MWKNYLLDNFYNHPSGACDDLNSPTAHLRINEAKVTHILLNKQQKTQKHLMQATTGNVKTDSLILKKFILNASNLEEIFKENKDVRIKILIFKDLNGSKIYFVPSGTQSKQKIFAIINRINIPKK